MKIETLLENLNAAQPKGAEELRRTPIVQLKQDRAAALEMMVELNGASEKQHPNLRNAVAFLENELTNINAEIRRKEGSESMEAGPRSFHSGNIGNGDASGAIRLTRSQKLSDHVNLGLPEGVRSVNELSFGRYLRGIVTGEWKGADAEHRATLASGVDSLGGYLVPTALSARVIDIARTQARVIEAGAVTFPMESGEMSVATVTKDPVPAWKQENAAAALTDVNFGKVDMRARTLIGLVKASVELIEDAPNIGRLIEQTLARTLALELDRAALRGNGVGAEPLGLRNWPGVQTYSMGDNGLALASHAPFSQAIQKVWEANGQPNAVIYAPRTAGEVDRLQDTTDQPMQPFPSFAALTKLVTNQVPINLVQGTASDASDAYVGDFTQMAIGVRTQLRLEVSREAADSADSAFRNLQVWIRAYLRADVIVEQPGHFCIVVGIIPPTP